MDDFNFEEIERATQAKRTAAAARPSKFLPKAKARPVRAPAKPQSPTKEARAPTKEQEAAEETEHTKLAEAVERSKPAEPAEPADKAEPTASPELANSVQPVEPASAPRSEPTGQMPMAAAEGTPEPASAEKLSIVPVADQIHTMATQGSGSVDTDSDSEKKPKRRKRIATGKKVKPATERKLTAEELANVELNPRDPILKYVQRAQAQERLRVAEQKRRRAEGGDMEEDRQQLALEAPPQAPPSSGGAIEFELIDGKMAPKQQSMVIQAQAAQVHGPVTEYKNVINNLSYSKRMSNERWSAEETEMFFQAIQTFGTDFELISRLFPGRQRKALANKWRRESKANPDRVNAVYNRTGDISKMQKLVEALAGGEGVEKGEDGAEDGKLGGLLASDLFQEASQALAPVSSSQAAGDLEEQSAAPPPRRGRGRGRGASTAREQSQPSSAAQSLRRGTSRRKRQPAQSVPFEHDVKPAKVERRTSGRRTKQREAMPQTKKTAAVSQREELS